MGSASEDRVWLCVGKQAKQHVKKNQPLFPDREILDFLKMFWGFSHENITSWDVFIFLLPLTNLLFRCQHLKTTPWSTKRPGPAETARSRGSSQCSRTFDTAGHAGGGGARGEELRKHVWKLIWFEEPSFFVWNLIFGNNHLIFFGKIWIFEAKGTWF